MDGGLAWLAWNGISLDALIVWQEKQVLFIRLEEFKGILFAQTPQPLTSVYLPCPIGDPCPDSF